MFNVIIRPFEVKDLQEIRVICCDVADKGDPIDQIFIHRNLAADLLTGYYMDFEPESTFVAEHEGKIVGYIQGSLDNRRYGLAMFFIVVPMALIKALKGGVFFDRSFWIVAGAMFRNWPRLFSWRKKSFHHHQGHIHLGIVKAFRHQQVGQALLAKFLSHAREHGAGEVTASVHDGNAAACRFFERNGFEVVESYPMVMPHEEYRSLFYVKKII